MTLSFLPKTTRGSLISIDRNIQLTFDINPESINREDGADYAAHQAPGAIASRYEYTGGIERTISFELVLSKVGRNESYPDGILPEMAKLEAFTYPNTRTPITKTQFIPPSKALFIFGPRTWEVIVARVSWRERLFRFDGVPTYATASVSLIVDSIDSEINAALANIRSQYAFEKLPEE